MNLATLKSVVAGVHQKDPDDLTLDDGTDMFLVTANSVRRNAEMMHNFEYCRVTATLDIDGITGGSLDDAVLDDPDSHFSKIKEVVAIQRRRADHRLVPVDFTRADIPIERDRWVLELRDDFWPEVRYPSDAQSRARLGRATLIQRGRQIFRYPQFPDAVTGPPITYNLECIGLLRDYVDDDMADDAAAPDFIVDYGFDYLKWAIVYALNANFQTFVPRQEGNVGNDAKAILTYREEAWRDLVIWDTYQIDANSTRSR
jgi:hypothetical protein